MDERVLAMTNASNIQTAILAAGFTGILLGVALNMVMQVLAERRLARIARSLQRRSTDHERRPV